MTLPRSLFGSRHASLWIASILLALTALLSPPSSSAQASPARPPESPAEAQRFADTLAAYRKQCDDGNAQVCYALGSLFFSGGGGLTRSFPEALALFTKACDGGFADGCSHLGAMYGAGSGVAVDMPHAVSLYQKACDLKSNHSCYVLCQSGVKADCSSTYGAFDEEMKAASDALTIGDLESAASHLHAAAAVQPANPQPLFDEAVLTAYRVVPNLSTEANLALAQRATDTLHAVLKLRPDDGLALRVLATLHLNTQQLDPAEETLLHIIKLAPDDYEAEYTLGYIDWRRAYPNVVQGLRNENLTYTDDNYARASAALCKSIATRNLPLLEDGTRHLRKALTLHPDDRNALMVLSLMDRLRAGTHCGDAAARAADLATANQWLVKVRALPASSRPTSPQPPSTLQPLSKTMIQVVTAPPAAPQSPPVAR